MEGSLSRIKRVLIQIDKVIERIAVGMLVAMILIVFVQVVGRKLLGVLVVESSEGVAANGFTRLFGRLIPGLKWILVRSEEVTLLCLTWFSFMGIAIGFRERIHLSMDMIASILPKRVNWVLDKLIDLTTFAFGLYLVVYGWEFTALMAESTLAATKLPNAVQYAVMPITGVLTCIYSALQLLGHDLRRFQNIDEEIKTDDA
jgi:TRAP-type C4-dicarboxylate transport system permease small subunit